MNVEVGYVDSFGSKEYFFFKNFYVGGIGFVCGYDMSMLGLYDNDLIYGIQCFGGICKVVGMVELFFLMFGLGIDKFLCLGIFIDVGQVWGVDLGIMFKDVNGFCYSVGFLVMWVLLMGFLKFSLGVFLNKQDNDKMQLLQFMMG